jgi:hypothetical protein
MLGDIIIISHSQACSEKCVKFPERVQRKFSSVFSETAVQYMSMYMFMLMQHIHESEHTHEHVDELVMDTKMYCTL